MRILVVDDSSDARLLLKAILGAAGLRDVLFAESAEDAFDQLGLETGAAATDVDLVLMDYTMPGLDGVEACRRIKSTESLRNVPIIMVTANSGHGDLQRAFAAGAMDYIAKPFFNLELLARVRSALASKSDRDELARRERALLELKAQLETANAELKRLAISDGLTGLHNRRYFDQTLTSECARARRDCVPLSLILVDVDHFKLINDRHGHPFGDACLKEIAAAIVATLRRALDVAARYGGEEFALVLPNTHARGALLVAERVRRAVAGLKIVDQPSQVEVPITVSLGVATSIPRNQSAREELLGSADHALYRAKANGRNQVATMTSPREGNEKAPGPIA